MHKPETNLHAQLLWITTSSARARFNGPAAMGSAEIRRHHGDRCLVIDRSGRVA
jgi:hypothetical protein